MKIRGFTYLYITSFMQFIAGIALAKTPSQNKNPNENSEDY